MFWAGPLAGKLLADLGAEVIKVESSSHPDALRVFARGNYPDQIPGVRPWNRSGMINDRNRNKLGITLDLRQRRGRELFLGLVRVSDVVIENFSTRVMASWGLDYPALRAVNSRVILASLYSQGSFGPESTFVSYGSTLEQLGGLAFLTGYADSLPGVLGLQLPDAMGGGLMVGLVLSALRARNRDGVGMHIDLSQRENVTLAIGEQLLDFGMNGRNPERRGNEDPVMAPHGCYPARGTDKWVTIAVENDDQWTALCKAMSQPELALDPRFVDSKGRRRFRPELDATVSSWTRRQSALEATQILQDHRVPAGPVYDAQGLREDPHLLARAFWDTVHDTDAGQHIYAGHPVRFGGERPATVRPAPTLGQDSDDVLRRLLGLTEAELDELNSLGITGTEPQGAERGASSDASGQLAK